MSSRLQASCFSLLLAPAVICVASLPARSARQESTPQLAASHWSTPDALPNGRPAVVYYASERSLQQPTVAAHARAPFVNIFAIYRRGLPDMLRLRAQEEATPDVSRHHFLLNGQKTA